MKRVMTVVASVVLLALVGTLTLASASQDSGAREMTWRRLMASAPERAGDSDRDQRVVVVERTAPETEIDNPPKGFSQGDELAFSGVLYQGGKRVGYDDGHVVITFISETQVRFHATFTSTIRGDEITAAGSAAFSETGPVDFEFSVTGGTGRYDDVGGEVTAVEQGQAVKFVYDLEDLG